MNERVYNIASLFYFSDRIYKNSLHKIKEEMDYSKLSNIIFKNNKLMNQLLSSIKY